jgi:hypothetical protein
MKPNEQLKQPFFAKLLEAQNVIPSSESKDQTPSFTVVALDGYQTMKYPSDNDEDGTRI